MRARLQLHDSAGNLSQPLIRKADHGHILDIRICCHEILDLHGIEVLAAGDDDILLAVHKPEEPVLVLARHISRMEPSILEGFCRSSRILVVALHEAGTLDAELADAALGYFVSCLVDDLCLPAISRHADRTHMVDVLESQMHAARSCRLGKAVVRVVLVVREDLLPAPDEALRHGLGADMHKPPLVEVIVGERDRPLLDGREDVLCPGNEEPHDRAALRGDRGENRLRRDATKEHALAAHKEASEPVHHGTGMVEGRDAEEHVLMHGLVMDCLHLCCLRERAMMMEDGLGKAGRSG